MNTQRAVFYVRLSRDSATSTSIQGQNDDLYREAENNGWQIVHVFEDNGKSGGSARDNAVAALDMLRDGLADVLAVYAYDRWSRMGIAALGDLINVIDARRAAAKSGTLPPALFYAAREGIRSDQPDWELRAAFAADLAKRERELIQSRRTAAIARMRLEGRNPGNGPAPYGYRSAPFDDGRPGRRFIPDPDESAIIREVANRLIAGESTVKLALELTKRHVPMPHSEYRLAQLKGDDLPTDNHGNPAITGTWTSARVSQLWQSDHLTGHVRVGTSRAAGGKSDGHLLLDPATGLPLRSFEPVLDDDTLAALKRRFGGTNHKPLKRRAALPLSGLVYCGNCGSRLYVVRDRDGFQYRCSSLSRGTVCPGPIKRTADPLESAVFADFLSAYGRLPMVQIIERVSSPETEQQRSAINARISEISAQLAPETNDDAAQVLFTEQRRLAARRAELDALPTVTVRERVPLGGTMAEHFAKADDDGKRQLLMRAYDHIDVYRRKDAVPLRFFPNTDGEL
jgi:DNA invertase Pin-like site-specific DNA recombinase